MAIEAASGKQLVVVSTLSLVTLLDNVYTGAAHADVGFEDADQTIDELTRKLNQNMWLSRADLESCLWSCNLLNEMGKFRHFRGDTFQQFLNQVVKTGKFNLDYNFIMKGPANA